MSKCTHESCKYWDKERGSCFFFVEGSGEIKDMPCYEEEEETSDLTTQIMCPNCLTYWKNISIPKDIWYNGTFRCPKCGEYLIREKEEK